jgi:hypothetical protein
MDQIHLSPLVDQIQLALWHISNSYNCLVEGSSRRRAHSPKGAYTPFPRVYIQWSTPSSITMFHSNSHFCLLTSDTLFEIALSVVVLSFLHLIIGPILGGHFRPQQANLIFSQAGQNTHIYIKYLHWKWTYTLFKLCCLFSLGHGFIFLIKV